MNRHKKQLLATATLCFGIGLTIPFLISNDSFDTGRQSHISEVPYCVKPLQVPEQATFAGQTIDLKRYDHRERMDRELMSFTYMHSTTDAPTGLAAITVEENGDNRITVFPGANDCLTADDAEEALLCYPDAVLLHFEIPNEAILSAAKYAAKQGGPSLSTQAPQNRIFPSISSPTLRYFLPTSRKRRRTRGSIPPPQILH